MSNIDKHIDKQALLINAQLASSGKWIKESGDGWEAICSSDDQANSGFIIAHFEGPDAKENREFIQAANPATVLALLDELDAKETENESMALELLNRSGEIEGLRQRIAELESREINLPPYSFFEFKQGSPFKSGAYCHIDSVNKELSKHCIKMIAAAGKGDAA